MDKISIGDVNWFDEISKRRSIYHDLYKKIKNLNKQIKKIGTINAVEFIAESIEENFHYPCRVDSNHGQMYVIHLFSKAATRKQIQYRRPEMIIGGLCLVEYKNGELAIPPLKDSCDPYIILPHDLNSVFNLLIHKGG